MQNSFGDVAPSWITGEDAARLAVSALLHPERFGEGPAVYLSGSSSCSHAEIAALLSAKLGRVIRHETIPPEAWAERLRASASSDARINGDMARHISALGAAMRQWPPHNDLFERVTGGKPVPIADVIASGNLLPF